MDKDKAKEKDKKEKPKRSWKKLILAGIVFYIFLLAAIALILSPGLETVVVNNAVREYTSLRMTPDQFEQNRTRRRPTVEITEDISIPELPEVIQGLPFIEGGDVIGMIAIESVGIYLPIFYGATHLNLLAGAGTMRPNQIMGRGNYVLAGHHMRDPTLLFGPLMHVEEGHWIQISNGENVYTYRIFERRRIHQSDTWIIDDTEEAIITLFTCDESGYATDFRWMVRGYLVDDSNISQFAGGVTVGGATVVQGDIQITQFASVYLNFREMIHRDMDSQRDLLLWALQVAGIALAVDVLGLILFTGIERKYKEIKKRNEERAKRHLP